MQTNSKRTTAGSCRRFCAKAVVAIIGAVSLSVTGIWAAETPETVLVTFHVKPAKADELAQLLTRSWSTYQRLGMVLDKPHFVVRSKESDANFFELLSWRSHSMPDTAPAEVRELWNQMEALCEPRNNRSGIEFVEVELMSGQKD
jgi:hypothetical protein